MRSNRPILLIEDDEVDAMTVRRALKEINVSNEVVHSENGEEALEYLKSSGKRPSIILLDLNMPIMSGLEFLEERMKNDEWRSIPAVVLTTSKDDFDKANSFKLAVSGYMVKPVDYSEFIDIIKKIDAYWTVSESLDL